MKHAIRHIHVVAPERAQARPCLLRAVPARAAEMTQEHMA